MAAVALSELNRINQLYKAGYHDAFLDNALRKIVERQIARDADDLQKIERRLSEFERQFGLTSDEFWKRYTAGQMGDTADYMEWNAYCKMHQRISSRSKILRADPAHE